MPDTDTFLRRINHSIATVGWAVTYVMPDENDPDPTTPFAYTVGLTAHGHPELLIAGLSPVVAHSLLNDLARRVYNHAEQLTHNQRVNDLIAGYDAVIVEGPILEQLLPGAVIGCYGRDQVRLLQIVWPDPQGRFPWETDYNINPNIQPLIAQP